ncbi:MAG: hypothetical protein JXR83_19695 [Deltaproteobacteria bacterium]|nr:hypothetical protein [Deltaproteobacteria bacterium]
MAASMAGGALFPRHPAPTPPAPHTLFAPAATEDDSSARQRPRGDARLPGRSSRAKIPASPLGDFPLLVDETRVC